ncbi:MAG: hypothetical protein GYB32_14885 [Algicola sp.]|nr:hypothetical protein [Algicola sp.]
MAHQLLKLYSFLFYLLALIAFFFMGITIAGIVGAGKNQGLAGGAIVLGYAVIASLIGLVISLVVANKTSRKIIFRLNIILALSIVGFVTYYQIKYEQRQKAQRIERQKTEQPKQKTQHKDAGFFVSDSSTALGMTFFKICYPPKSSNRICSSGIPKSSPIF